MRTFEENIDLCLKLSDEIAAIIGSGYPDKNFRGINELEKENIRLKVFLENEKKENLRLKRELEQKNMENNSLKRWIAKIN